MSDKSRVRVYTAIALAATALVVAPDGAYAGTTGTEFDSIYTTVTGWVEGTLGRLISVVAVVAGLAMGVMRGAVIPFLIGIGVALGLNSAPTIINGIVTATLPDAAAVSVTLATIPLN